MMTSPNSKASILPGHIKLPEPKLSFHATREADSDSHPLVGLRKFGPYSRSVLGGVVDPIRVGVIGPNGCEVPVGNLLRELESEQQPTERRAYLVPFDGLSTTFGVSAQLSRNAIFNVPEPSAGIGGRHRQLADSLLRALAQAQTRRSEFDVLAIYLPDRWEECFYVRTEVESFDLHDAVKCHAASLSIPTQILRESRVFNYKDRCSVLWRLSIALYSKAGGIPWKLAEMAPNTLYIGLGYAIRYDSSRQPYFLTACSQVFDCDGTGLEFLAYETQDLTVEQRGNPFLKRGTISRIMSRSLDLYLHRHSGRLPNTVVVHKYLPFNGEEIDGCFDAFSNIDSVELIQIYRDGIWRGAHLDPPQGFRKEKNRPGYAVHRGTCMLTSPTEALLWTQGNVPQQGGKDFFKEMKGTPQPLVVKRFAGDLSMSQCCRAILALTKMDWNNDALYDRVPMTIEFASKLAKTIKCMPKLTARPYSIQFFM